MNRKMGIDCVGNPKYIISSGREKTFAVWCGNNIPPLPTDECCDEDSPSSGWEDVYDCLRVVTA